jgi:hypothetical protein
MSNETRKPYNSQTFEEIDKKAEDQSRFVKPIEGQPLILEFFPERTEIKKVDFHGDGKFTERVNFVVKTVTGKEKEISFGIATARRIINLLRRGITRLEIIRIGGGLNTKYDFIPA